MNDDVKVVITGTGLMLFGMMMGLLAKENFNNRQQRIWDNMVGIVIKDNDRLKSENKDLKNQLKEEA